MVGSARLYFYPIIIANMLSMTIVIGGNPVRALLFSLVISFLASFGFLINDLWDINIDKINKPGHFEDSSPGFINVAKVSCVGFLVAGLILSYFIGALEFFLAAGIAAGLAAYTVLLRRLLFVPNVLAAVLASSPLWIPLIFWSKDYDGPKLMFVGAVIIFILAREIIMDTRDTVGDIIGDRDTFATVFNTRIGRFIGVILTVSACLPFIFAMTTSVYNNFVKTQVLAIGVACILLFLLVPSAVKTLLSVSEVRAAIDIYVTRSRMAMSLIPVIVLLLWLI